MSARDQQLQAFQEFQKNFFTSPKRFNQYTIFDVKKHAFVLLNNISKGYPALMDIVMNMKGFGWSAITSFELLRALQKKLMNPYTGNRMPQYIFYKGSKKEKQLATKTHEGLDFSSEVRREICQLLMLDSKSYEDLKYTETVQKCGKQVIGDILQSKETQVKRNKKTIK